MLKQNRWLLASRDMMAKDGDQFRVFSVQTLLVGGLEHFLFFHILGIVIQID